MKESFWGYLIIILALFVIIVMTLVQNLGTTDEQNYYLVKEAMEGAMIDSIDYGVYRNYGEIRIIEDKFVENFIRRFSESVQANRTYKIDFYEIYESPPKATIRVTTTTGAYTIDTSTADFDIITILSGILESKIQSETTEQGS